MRDDELAGVDSYVLYRSENKGGKLVLAVKRRDMERNHNHPWKTIVAEERGGFRAERSGAEWKARLSDVIESEHLLGGNYADRPASSAPGASTSNEL